MRDELMRFFWPGIGTVLFLGLCFYVFVNYEEHYPSIERFSQTPSSYDGRFFEAEGRIIKKDGGYYFVTTSNVPIEVRYDWSGWEPSRLGTFVIMGVMHKEGFIEILDMHKGDYHMTKYYVSILGFIIFLFIFFKEWSVSWRGFRERGVDNA